MLVKGRGSQMTNINIKVRTRGIRNARIDGVGSKDVKEVMK